MDRETARQKIKDEWRGIADEILDPAKERINGEKSYVCPFCGHGRNGDGLTVNKKSAGGTSLHCFGCNYTGDIIDLYMKLNGKGYNDALGELAEMQGIAIDAPLNVQKRPQNPENNRQAQAEAEPAETQEEADIKHYRADYTLYYDKCSKQIEAPEAAEYLQKRGISVETAKAYCIGFDPAADPASAPGAIYDIEKKHPTPRIIIPTTMSHYVARAISADVEKKYKALNPKQELGGGPAGIFNAGVLQASDVDVIFVTEGVFNALSIIEAGSTAIATNSASNVDILIKAIETRQPTATLALAFDNDKAGRTATEKMSAALRKLNVSYIECGPDVIGPGGESKDDANDLLVKNRAKFCAAVARIHREAESRPDSTDHYLIQGFREDIAKFGLEIKTGFENLDEYAGGLYSGLYVLAATSSLGKTTFALQMADQIATAGKDVLFFSMEQSRLEMVSKSIARNTYIMDPEKAVSSLAIRRGWTAPVIDQAIDHYIKTAGPLMSVIEGNFNCTISFIGDYIRRYIKKNGTRPVCFIDYLQILQPEQINGRQQTTKEAMDAAVTQLKRLSRELDITIICISSVNRAGYLMPIDFESLKESGGIEYSADVIWGLQLQCLKEDLFANEKTGIKEKRERIKEAKAERVRGIELVCLKNRYGIANYSCYFNYRPANDHYEPADCDYDYPQKTPKAGRKI